MKENVITVCFDTESEAYQALSELKKYPQGTGFFASAAGLLKKSGGQIRLEDGYDTGAETGDDTVMGGLLGSLIGILGGPLGVLFGGSMGLLIGSSVDADDALENASLIEQVTGDIKDDHAAIIALVQEDEDHAFERFFDHYSVTVTRHDAAEVAAEVEEVQKIQKEMAKEAGRKLRAEKKAEWAQKIETKRREIRLHFDHLRNK